MAIRQRSIWLACFAGIMTALYAQSPDMSILQPLTGTGAAFGARDPYSCRAGGSQLKGAPTAVQVQAMVTCAWERATGNGSLAELYLTENVKVQIGKSRPFERGDGSGNVDVNQPVYPIRGSFSYYRCYPVNSAHPSGQNCKKTEQPNAEGLCFKTTFGDWKCTMSDIQTRVNVPGYVAAPH